MILRRAPRSTTEPTAPTDRSTEHRAAPAANRPSRPPRARSLGAAPLGLLLAIAATSGCYSGEWRTGVETPVAVTSRLLPTRTVETWELSATTVPYVLQLKGTMTPRCRMALYGKSRRTDTGKFERVGGAWWKALAIISGVGGVFGLGFGAGGYVPSIVDPTYGRPIMYAAGSGLVVGGLVSCFMALSRPSRTRQALCGVLTGLGGSVLAGSVLSTLPSPNKVAQPGQPTPTLIDPAQYQQILLAGAGLAGGAVATGAIASLWRGYDDRARVVTIDNASLWDEQQPEQTCGALKPLLGRTVGLEIVAENAAQGLGSEAQPMKMRVAIAHAATQPVDLTPLRQALPSCGTLTVRIVPDVVYERFSEDFTPPVTPDLMNKAAQPIYGHIVPADGMTLPVMEGRLRPSGKQGVPGLPAETLARVERACRGEPEPVAPGKAPPRRPTPQPMVQGPRPVQAPVPPAPEPGAPVEPAQPEQPVAPAPPVPRPDEFVMTPGVSLAPRPADQQGQPAEGECSVENQQSRVRDCEHQCGKALALMPCVMDFRKCAIEARYSSTSDKDRALCDLAFEQCLYRVGVSTSSWHRCVEGCVEVNEPPRCKYKPPRLTP